MKLRGWARNPIDNFIAAKLITLSLLPSREKRDELRLTFSGLLAEQPAMENVLADLAIESEASTVAAMRVARSWDDESEHRSPPFLARRRLPIGERQGNRDDARDRPHPRGS